MKHCDRFCIYLVFSVLLLSSCKTSNDSSQSAVSPHINSVTVEEFSAVDFSKGFVNINFKTKKIGVYGCDSLPEKEPLKSQIASLCVYTHNYISQINSLFKRKVNLDSQKKYQNLKITYGDLVYQTTPKQYIFPKDSKVDETIVYHELGHRLMEIIKNKYSLELGGVSSFLNIGIVDYFAASFSNNPNIGKSLLPSSLYRNLSENVRYPESLVTIHEMANLFDKEYKSRYISRPYHKEFHKLFLSLATKNPKTIEGHMSSKVVSSALWILRKEFGSVVDTIVANTLMLLAEEARLSKRDAGWDKFFKIILENSKQKNICMKAKKIFISRGFSAGVIKNHICK